MEKQNKTPLLFWWLDKSSRAESIHRELDTSVWWPRRGTVQHEAWQSLGKVSPKSISKHLPFQMRKYKQNKNHLESLVYIRTPSKHLYVGPGFAEKADDVSGWEHREVGVCVMDWRCGAMVTGQRAGRRCGAGLLCSSVTCHGSRIATLQSTGEMHRSRVSRAAFGKWLEGGSMLLQMQRSCQGTERSSQFWQRLCRCSSQVTF